MESGLSGPVRRRGRGSFPLALRRELRCSGTTAARSASAPEACFPVWIACTSISIAWPVFAGTTTVAASSPLRTHAWPVFGRPSAPMKGRPSQRSRPALTESSWKAFLAPTRMASSWAAMTSICVWCEVERRSHELTALNELASAPLPFEQFHLHIRGFGLI